jgi:hypothetical protein
MDVETILMVIGTIFYFITISFVFFGDHLLFLFAEHMFIGATTAFGIFVVATSLSDFALSISAGRVALIIGFIFGILVFTRLTKYRWSARYPVAMLSGIGIGVVFGLTMRSQILNGIVATVSNLATGSPDPISALVLAVFMTLILLHFTYSQRFSGIYHTGRLAIVERVARICLMFVCGHLFTVVMLAEGVDALAKQLLVIKRTFDVLGGAG